MCRGSCEHIPQKPVAARTTIMKTLWDYIKEHGLQDPNDGRYVYPDDVMAGVFGRDRMLGFGMAKFLRPHLIPIPMEEILEEEKDK